LVFHRWKGPEHYLVVATLNDFGWPDGYQVPTPIEKGSWREVFSSDAPIYGGAGVSNEGDLEPVDGKLTLKLPARGFSVLRYVPRA